MLTAFCTQHDLAYYKAPTRVSRNFWPTLRYPLQEAFARCPSNLCCTRCVVFLTSTRSDRICLLQQAYLNGNRLYQPGS